MTMHQSTIVPVTAPALPVEPRMRASDEDRRATVTLLEDAVARGLLTPDEGGDRMASAFGARFRDELPLLTADLTPAGSSAAVTGGWRALGAALVAQLDTERRIVLAGGPPARRRLVLLAVAVALLVALAVVAVLVLHALAHGGGDPRSPLDGGTGRFPFRDGRVPWPHD